MSYLVETLTTPSSCPHAAHINPKPAEAKFLSIAGMSSAPSCSCFSAPPPHPACCVFLSQTPGAQAAAVPGWAVPLQPPGVGPSGRLAGADLEDCCLAAWEAGPSITPLLQGEGSGREGGSGRGGGRGVMGCDGVGGGVLGGRPLGKALL
jgi:hypothetical protein